MSVIGIVGAGQLARMLVLAGLPLGLRFVLLDPAEAPCAADLGTHLHSDYDDRAQLARLARACDVVTYEFENVPDESVTFLAENATVRPGAASLSAARDRLREKTLFRDLRVPTPRFAEVDSRAELERAVATIGLPAVLKTRTLGYDGKGQAVLRRPEEVSAAWTSLGGVPLLLETQVQFQREVSVIGVRDRRGKCRFYALSENLHHDGILRLTRSRPGDPFEPQAQEYARRLLDHLGHVGVLTLELFQVGDALLANEIAPRVHNSGHWTIEGAVTSQFENHLRALLDWPLGDTTAVGHSAMVNLVGEIPGPSAVVAVPGAHLHLYGKKPRAGRKLGHITVSASTPSLLEDKLRRLLRAAGPREPGATASSRDPLTSAWRTPPMTSTLRSSGSSAADLTTVTPHASAT